MKTIISVYQIMGNVKVGEYRQKKRTGKGSTAHTGDKEQEEKPFDREACLKYWGRTKKKNREMLGMTDTFENSKRMLDLIGRNGAVMSHLVAFSNVARYALKNGYRIGYGEYCKRMKMEDVKTEWKRIRAWLDGHTENVALAMTIGVANKGYVYIRFLVTSPEEIRVHDASVEVARYLRHTRRFNPQELRPYEKDAEAFIHGRYVNDDVKTLVEIMELMPSELWEVMRASFVIPGGHRTYKSREACKVIDEMVKMVNARKIDGVNVEALGMMKYFMEGLWAITPMQKGDSLSVSEETLEEDLEGDF